MSKTFRQWVLFVVVATAAVFMTCAAYATSGQTGDEVRNEVRMSVDFTVLPVLETEDMEPAAQPDAQEQTAADSPAPDTGADVETAAPQPEPESAEAKPEPEPTAAPAAPAAGTGQVASVTFQETPRNFILTIATDRPVGDTSYLNLNNPRRLVIDLLGKWNYRGRNVLRSEGVIKHVVIGEHKDRLRLVAHYRADRADRAEPQFTREGNKLYVSVPKE